MLVVFYKQHGYPKDNMERGDGNIYWQIRRCRAEYCPQVGTGWQKIGGMERICIPHAKNKRGKKSLATERWIPGNCTRMVTAQRRERERERELRRKGQRMEVVMAIRAYLHHKLGVLQLSTGKNSPASPTYWHPGIASPVAFQFLKASVKKKKRKQNKNTCSEDLALKLTSKAESTYATQVGRMQLLHGPS